MRFKQLTVQINTKKEQCETGFRCAGKYHLPFSIIKHLILHTFILIYKHFCHEKIIKMSDLIMFL